MTIKDEARAYAVKVLENDISRIEQAYMDGYNAAKAKYSNEAIVDEEYRTITVEGKTSEPIEWISLSLPSGIQWSKPVEFRDEDNLIRPFDFTYNQVKGLSLPTIGDIIELEGHTDSCIRSHRVEHKDIDGKIFDLYDKAFFWLDHLENDPKYRKSANAHLNVKDRFMGDKAYLVLVKHKE